MTSTRLKPAALALIAGVAALGAQAVPKPAEAASRCGQHDEIVKVLTKKYKEHRTAVGLVSEKGVMELFVSRSGNWTALFTRPNGIACVLAAGSSLETIKTVALGPEV
ncbi:MAG: hypothetical protein AAF441_10360 [Pseudomonadota bacterium]